VNKLVEELNVIRMTENGRLAFETRKTRTWAEGGFHVDVVGHRAAERLCLRWWSHGCCSSLLKVL